MIKEEQLVGMNTIDAKTLQRAFLAGAKSLEAKKEWINELNVFPVPDGDTGTNMTMTIMSAAREVAAIEEPTMENLAKAISSGSLRGARGNSGVILSQLFRGFTKEIKSLETITTTTLANAFVRATETAYKKPNPLPLSQLPVSCALTAGIQSATLPAPAACKHNHPHRQHQPEPMAFSSHKVPSSYTNSQSQYMFPLTGCLILF